MPVEYVDFHAVEDKHQAIHAELENWARWLMNRPASHQGPIWRLGKPPQHWEQVESGQMVDKLKAAQTEKAVSALPVKHCAALRWSYVFRTNPRREANRLGLTLDGLFELVHDGRQMLVNRGAR
jgi:hypothetical protein